MYPYTWGFLCPPLLWVIGMLLIWIPLVAEPEEDPEKAQKVEELITIVRRTELKYAKRCARALLVFCAGLLILIGVVVLAVHFSR